MYATTEMNLNALVASTMGCVIKLGSPLDTEPSHESTDDVQPAMTSIFQSIEICGKILLVYIPNCSQINFANLHLVWTDERFF